MSENPDHTDANEKGNSQHRQPDTENQGSEYQAKNTQQSEEEKSNAAAKSAQAGNEVTTVGGGESDIANSNQGLPVVNDSKTADSNSVTEGERAEIKQEQKDNEPEKEEAKPEDQSNFPLVQPIEFGQKENVVEGEDKDIDNDERLRQIVYGVGDEEDLSFQSDESLLQQGVAASQKSQQESIQFSEIPATYLFAVKHLYECPHEDFKRSSINNNVVFLSGPPNSGKLFSALGLLTDDDDPSEKLFEKIYKASLKQIFGAAAGRNLVDIAQEASRIADNSVIILENFFDSGFGTSDLQEERIDRLKQLLAEKQLLLLVTINSQRAFNLPANCTLIKHELSRQSLKERQQFIENVTTKHLANFNECYPSNRVSEDYLSAIAKANEDIKASFDSPSQVYLLFSQLAFQRAEIDDALKLVRQLINEFASVGQGISAPWFNGLSPNHQLYALLVALLEEMPAEQVHQVYQGFCGQLRKQKYNIRDAREVGTHDLIRNIYVRIDDSGALDESGIRKYQFINENYALEAKRQIDNYRDLLWDAVIYLLRLLDSDKHRSLAVDAQWLPHIGKAVGLLGKDHWSEFLVEVDHLGGGAPGIRSLLPASALSSAILLNPEKTLLIIERWIKEYDSPKFVFNATVAIARSVMSVTNEIRQNDASELQDVLERLEDLLAAAILYDFPRNFLTQRNAFDYAIDRMFESDLPRMVQCICRWMSGQFVEASSMEIDSNGAVPEFQFRSIEEQDEEEDREQDNRTITAMRLPEIGFFYAYRRLIQYADFEKISNEHKIQLLNLAEQLILFEPDSEFEDSILLDDDVSETDSNSAPISSGLRILRRWLHQENANELRGRLMKLVQKMSVAQRRRLKRVLQYDWLATGDELSVDIADCLLTFAHVLDGIPIDPSSEHFGCIIIGLPDRSRLRAQGEARNIFRRLTNHVEIKIAGQGNDKWLDNEEGKSKMDLFDDQLDPCLPLCVPLLEQLDPSKVHFILMLQWKKYISAQSEVAMLDIDDINRSSSLLADLQDRTIVVADARSYSSVAEQNNQNVIDHHVWNLYSNTTCNRLEDLISQKVANNITQRSLDSNRIVLQKLFPEVDRWGFEDTHKLLLETASNIDIDFSSSNLKDAGKKISGLFNYLLTLDRSATLSAIRDWLPQESEPSRAIFGKAFFHLFFRMNRNKRVTVDELKKLLLLGQVFIGQPKQFRFEFLCLIELLLHRSLPEHSDDKNTAADTGETTRSLFRNVPRSWKNQVLDRIGKLASRIEEPTEKQGLTESETNEIYERIEFHRQLQDEVMLGPILDIPEFGEQRLCIIIVDSGTVNRNRRLSIATKLYKTMREKFKDEGIIPMVFRTGCSSPVSINQPLSSDVLVPVQLRQFPNTILPILETFEENEIHSVLVLSDRVPLDWLEVQEYSPIQGSFYSETGLERWGHSYWYQIKPDEDMQLETVVKKIWRELSATNMSER